MTFITEVQKVINPPKQHSLIISSFGTSWWTCLNECIGTTVPLIYTLLTAYDGLQYLLIMIGGVTGTKRWYLHFSASRNNRCRPSGILASLLRVNISLIAFLSSPTSSMSTFSFFSRTLYPKSFGFGLVCTSQHRHLSQWWNGVTSEILVCYLEYPFLKQHMFFGLGISKMQFLPTHKSKYKKHPCILIMVVM